MLKRKKSLVEWTNDHYRYIHFNWDLQKVVPIGRPKNAWQIEHSFIGHKEGIFGGKPVKIKITIEELK